MANIFGNFMMDTYTNQVHTCAKFDGSGDYGDDGDDGGRISHIRPDTIVIGSERRKATIATDSVSKRKRNREVGWLVGSHNRFMFSKSKMILVRHFRIVVAPPSLFWLDTAQRSSAQYKTRNVHKAYTQTHTRQKKQKKKYPQRTDYTDDDAILYVYYTYM